MANSLTGIVPHFLYFALALVVVLVYLSIYVAVTPYKELALIRQGNQAAAISLGGALVGFAIPLARTVAQSVSIPDLLIWSAVAMVAQLLTYGIVRLALPALAIDIKEGRTAAATFLSAMAISVGLLNAAAMTV